MTVTREQYRRELEGITRGADAAVLLATPSGPPVPATLVIEAPA